MGEDEAATAEQSSLTIHSPRGPSESGGALFCHLGIESQPESGWGIFRIDYADYQRPKEHGDNGGGDNELDEEVHPNSLTAGECGQLTFLRCFPEARVAVNR